MTTIVAANKEDVMDFNEKEWQKVNDLHFGPGVKWNTTQFFFKAVENNEIVGLIFGKHESGTIYISNIIVKEEKRRQGIGAKLVQKAEKFGKKFNDHKVWLISGKHYPEDLFFTKLGFKKEASIPNLFFHKDFIVYTKII